MRSSISSLFLRKAPLKPVSNRPKPLNFRTHIYSSGEKRPVAAPAAESTSFGFNNLKQTFSVKVQSAESRPLNVPLIAPFTISYSRLDKVENVAIRIGLSNGCVGWGEAPIHPSITAEDQPTALAKAQEGCPLLNAIPATTLGELLQQIGAFLAGHEFAPVRAGVEMALIDAVASSIGIPLWRLFGGASNTITTDITIPIVSPAEAAVLASEYCKQGFTTLKLKVGKDLKTDIEVLQAIRAVHPNCSFILDANAGYKPQEAIEVLERLHEMIGMALTVLGQFAKYGVSVAADESCRGIADARRIVEGGPVDVVNIKLAKLGGFGARDIIEVARPAGLELMIGGMIETRLSMGFAGHLAAGLGIFKQATKHQFSVRKAREHHKHSSLV